MNFEPTRPGFCDRSGKIVQPTDLAEDMMVLDALMKTLTPEQIAAREKLKRDGQGRDMAERVSSSEVQARVKEYYPQENSEAEQP